MLHPALAQALVTAHLEDLQRAAARRHTIRLVSAGHRAESRADPAIAAEMRASAPRWLTPRRKTGRRGRYLRHTRTARTG